jgi:CelD/BcsL family acetyltransferase involved in cellulose biosynthesis
VKWQVLAGGDFERRSLDWDRLAEAAGAPPFLRSAFLRPALREFGSPREVLAVCSAGGELRAMALLTPTRRGLWTTFQPSQLPLGAWIMHPVEDLESVLESLLRALPGFALAIGVTQVDPELIPRPPDRGRLRTLDYIETAWVPLEGSFDAYWEARGKNLRTNMRKQRAKLGAEGTNTRLEELTRPEEVAGVIADYGRLESAGWKAAGGTAIHPDNAQGRFYRAMLEAFCAAGAGRMYRYRFGDEVVAVDLCIEARGALVVLKTTYDERVKACSPAFLMRQEIFKRLFDEGRIRRVEFFGRLMDWHTRWTGEARGLYHINYYRWAWLPKLRDRFVPRPPPRPADGAPESDAVAG